MLLQSWYFSGRSKLVEISILMPKEVVKVLLNFLRCLCIGLTMEICFFLEVISGLVEAVFFQTITFNQTIRRMWITYRINDRWCWLGKSGTMNFVRENMPKQSHWDCKLKHFRKWYRKYRVNRSRWFFQLFFVPSFSNCFCRFQFCKYLLQFYKLELYYSFLYKSWSLPCNMV